MIDKDLIRSFWAARAEVEDPRLATHYKHDDALDFDVELVKRHLVPDASVLDLGSGTCAMVNLLEPLVGKIVAVEQQGAFLRFAKDSPRIRTVEQDLMTFPIQDAYDLVLLFGVVNFLDASEEAALVSRIATALEPRGTFIMKHACGVAEEVVVDTFSEQIGSRYHARYPYVRDEMELLERHFRRVELVDIYPPRLNPWANTHFYAFVARS